MFGYLVFVVLVAVAFELTTVCIWTSDLLETNMIVGGKTVNIKDYPYQAHILVNGSHWCGGSIISNEWILTAAHCVDGISDRFSVRLGSTFNDFGGTDYSIYTVISHEYYWMAPIGKPNNDIAALRVSTPIVFDETIQPIPLFDAGEEAEPGVPVVVTGWGTLAENDSENSPTLQAVTMSIISKAECDAIYIKSGGGIPCGQICAGDPNGGKDSCIGDSGGPLVIDGRLAGIVSWGDGFGTPGFPGAYTEISWYRDWIRDNTGV